MVLRPPPDGQQHSGAMYLLIAVSVSLRAHDIGAGVGDSGKKMEQAHFVSIQPYSNLFRPMSIEKLKKICADSKILHPRIKVSSNWPL